MKMISQTFVWGKIWRKVKILPPFVKVSAATYFASCFKHSLVTHANFCLPCHNTLCVAHFAGPSVAVNRNAESNFFFDFAICWTEEVRTAGFDNIGGVHLDHQELTLYNFGWIMVDCFRCSHWALLSLKHVCQSCRFQQLWFAVTCCWYSNLLSCPELRLRWLFTVLHCCSSCPTVAGRGAGG